MAKEYLYLDDYQVGDRMISPARTVTEADIVNFAALTGDWHPLHTDAEYAAGGPFKGRIAHGMLVLSIGLSLPFRLGAYSSYLPNAAVPTGRLFELSPEVVYRLLRDGGGSLHGADTDRGYHPLRGGGHRDRRQGQGHGGSDRPQSDCEPEGRNGGYLRDETVLREKARLTFEKRRKEIEDG